MVGEMIQNEFKLKEGDKLGRNPNKPILSVGSGYVWIGNNAKGDMACYATLSGRKTLLKLAAAIKRQALKLK